MDHPHIGESGVLRNDFLLKIPVIQEKAYWNHWVCYIASLGIVLGYLKIFE